MTDPTPATKRLASWLPFAAAIAVPLTILAVMGVFSFEQSRHEAELRAQRTVQALAEHALRTFRAHDLIISAVDKHIDNNGTLAQMLAQLRGHWQRISA